MQQPWDNSFTIKHILIEHFRGFYRREENGWNTSGRGCLYTRGTSFLDPVVFPSLGM